MSATDPDPFRDKPLLQGDRVLLRPFTDDDMEAMGPILADPDVIRLTGSAHTSAALAEATPELDERTLDWYRGLASRTDRLDLAIVDRASDRCVGEAVLNALDADNDACNFRILIGPDGRDRGLGSEATRLLIDHAFRTTTLHRIGLEVYAFNPRAQRVYERAGFVVEGRLRDVHRYDDQRVDAIVMSMLRTDWSG